MQTQLRPDKSPENPNRWCISQQLNRLTTGDQQHACDRLLHIEQRYAQQRPPWQALAGQKTDVIEPVAEVIDTDDPVLTHGKLQQVLACVICWQPLFAGRLHKPVEPFCSQFQAFVRGIQYVQLAQLTATELGHGTHALADHAGAVSAARHAGKVLEQRLGIRQRVRYANKHRLHLKQTHTAHGPAGRG